MGVFFVPWAHISHKPCRRDEELREMGQKTAFRRRIQSGKKAIKEGESLSEQFGKDKEPYMNYYVFTGKKHS